MTFWLDWPPKGLSPNARLHPLRKHAIGAKYRSDCCYLAKSENAHNAVWPDGKLPVEIVFHPPTKHKRDLDNMIASFKAGQDGVADAMGVDDSRFVPTYHVGEVIKGGAVTFTVGSVG